MEGLIIAGVIVGIILVFLLVILVRTVLFRPKEMAAAEPEKILLNKEKIVFDMVDMIRCKTVSNREEALVDRAEFRKFEELLQERFPNVHNSCQF